MDVEIVWQLLYLNQNKTYYTAKHLPFTYIIKGNEMFVSRKEKSITKASVAIALKKAAQLEYKVTGPKKLGCFGASYLYPIFIELNIIFNLI